MLNKERALEIAAHLGSQVGSVDTELAYMRRSTDDMDIARILDSIHDLCNILRWAAEDVIAELLPETEGNHDPGPGLPQ